MAELAEPRRLVVLYASETGTAEDYAMYIASEARRRHFIPTVSSLDSMGISALAEAKNLCVTASTTGQGEEPRNMQTMWRMLRRRDLPSAALGKVRFGVLAFGDSSYPKFNFAGKKIYRRLVQLGAHPLVDVGLCDDQHDLGAEAVAGPWIGAFFEKLLKVDPLPKGLSTIPQDELLASTLAVEKVSGKSVVVPAIRPAFGTFTATLLENERLTAEEHFQDTRLLSFSVPKNRFSQYHPGDVAVVYPKNPPDVQAAFAELLGLNPADVLRVRLRDPSELCSRKKKRKSQDKAENSDSIAGSRSPALPCHLRSSESMETVFCLPDRLPDVCPVAYLLSDYWDLVGVPGVNFFRQLARHATDELEKEKLDEFLTPEGQQDLVDYCTRARRSAFEVFQDFHKTAKIIPLEHLLDIMPRIKPRYFSIASNPIEHSGEIHLLVAVVRYKTRLAKPRLGLCSNWLAGLEPKAQISMSIAPGALKIPDADVPCIFVAPGTGVAPFRSIILGRVIKEYSRNLLFFGFRSKTADYYFEDDWKQLQELGALCLHVAASRDQPQKFYVQHAMKRHADEVWAYLAGGAYVFVAGNAKQMPKDVTEALAEIATGYGVRDGKGFVDTLVKSNRLQFETWS